MSGKVTDKDLLPDEIGAVALVADAATGKMYKRPVIKTLDDVVDGTDKKAFTVAEKTKLGGIATSATANITDTASAALMDTKNTAAITALRASVPTAGDNLNKLYNLISAINTLLTSDDVNFDTLQEVVNGIKSEQGLITSLTTNKVNVADTVNVLTQTTAGKVLDARQGKALKDLVDALTTGKQNSVSLTTIGSSGAATFNQTTGALNIPIYTPGAGTAYAQIIDVAAAYGIVSDGSTDNATALMTMRTALAGLNKPFYYLLFPAGGYTKYSNNRWLYGINKFKLVGNGGIFQPIYVGSDDMFARPFSSGEMFQTNVLAYTGGKTYADSHLINSVVAGNNSVTFTTAANSTASPYAIGKRVLIRCFDQFGAGYPPSDKYHEIREIKSINTGTGVMTFTEPLENSYSSSYPDIPNVPDTGQFNGKARVFLLDGVNNLLCTHAEFEDLTFLPATGGAEANLVFSAQNLICTDVKNGDGWLWASENETATYTRCHIENNEFDKLVNNVKLKDCDFNGIASGGIGCDRIDFENVNFAQAVAIASRYISYVRCKFRADTLPSIFTDSLGLSPAVRSVREIVIDSCSFSSSAAASTSDHIQFGSFVQITIAVVSGKNIIIPKGTFGDAAAESYYNLDPGYTRLFKDDGTKSGIVTGLSYDATYNSGQGAFVISGSWATAPVVGEVWKYATVANVIDYGNHTVYDTKKLFNIDTFRWQGNKSRGKVKDWVFTQKDVKWDGDHTLQGIILNGFLISVSVNVEKPSVQQGLLQIFREDHGVTSPYGTIFMIDCTQRGYREMNVGGAFGSKGIDSLTYAELVTPIQTMGIAASDNSFGGVTSTLPADLPEFEVRFKWFQF